MIKLLQTTSILEQNKNDMENVKLWTLMLPSQAFPIHLQITLTLCYIWVVSDYDSVVIQTTEDCTTCMSFLAWCLINWAQSTFTFYRVTSSPNKNCIARFKVLRALFLRFHTFWDVAVYHWVSDILLELLNVKMKGRLSVISQKTWIFTSCIVI